MSFLKKIFKQAKATNENSFDGTHGNIILDFKSKIKIIDWQSLDSDKFAMWLPAPNDRIFEQSPLVRKWDEIYNITAISWSYITADLLKTLEVVEQDIYRINLPNEIETFGFVYQNTDNIILSISTEKGIRFHFSETMSTNSIENFIDDFIQYCDAWKNFIAKIGKDKDEDLGFGKWWKITKQTSIEMEKIEPLTGIGIINK